MSLASTSDVLRTFERDFKRRRHRSRLIWCAAITVLVVASLLSAYLAHVFETAPVTLPGGARVERWILWAGLPRLGDYVVKTLPELHWATFGSDLAYWFHRWRIWAALLLETVLIAFMATVLGVVGGFVLSFPASRNLSRTPRLTWVTRRCLEIARTVPELVFALIFVFCFGVGPMAGVLAVALHSSGALGKLYSEANENIDMRALEGVRAAGGSWFDQMRYGVVPQILPNTISYTLLRFEINVRSSSIIGFVGAGGLGQELRTAVTLQEYTDLSALFLIILTTVCLLDWISERIRLRIIGQETAS